MKAFILTVFIVFSFLQHAYASCSLRFTSPNDGSTVMTQNITVYGTGSANTHVGDYGTVTATLNGVVIFNVSGSFTAAMNLFASRGVAVTLRPGKNIFNVTGSVGGCSASDSMTVYYNFDNNQNLGSCESDY